MFKFIILKINTLQQQYLNIGKQIKRSNITNKITI